MLRKAKALLGLVTGVGGIKTGGRGAYVLDEVVRDADGNEAPLSDMGDGPFLLVNVASKCGCTPQYHDLVALQEAYGDQGLTVIGFPCNDFGGQEPGSVEEVQEFCSTKFGVEFPIMDKVKVKGSKAAPIYLKLTSNENGGFAGDIGWNFTKFLVGRDGHVRARFEPNVNPQAEEVIAEIEAALEE